MSPILLFTVVITYFLVLLGVAWITGRNSTNESFFIGNKNSNWMLVAFGMIGTSLSGVTFVSVPGGVGSGKLLLFSNCFGISIGIHGNSICANSFVLPHESYIHLYLSRKKIWCKRT